MKGWTETHIERLQQRGMTVIHVEPSAKVVSREAGPLAEMKKILKYMQVEFVTEYKFLDNRKFRFDIALLDEKIAIEYEGIFANKSRHTSVLGYSNDTTKYNLAVLNGWKVLRYTQLNYNNFLSDINALLYCIRLKLIFAISTKITAKARLY